MIRDRARRTPPHQIGGSHGTRQLPLRRRHVAYDRCPAIHDALSLLALPEGARGRIGDVRRLSERRAERARHRAHRPVGIVTRVFPHVLSPLRLRRARRPIRGKRLPSGRELRRRSGRSRDCAHLRRFEGALVAVQSAGGPAKGAAMTGTDVATYTRERPAPSRACRWRNRLRSCLRRLVTFVLEDARTIGDAINVVIAARAFERSGVRSALAWHHAGAVPAVDRGRQPPALT